VLRTFQIFCKDNLLQLRIDNLLVSDLLIFAGFGLGMTVALC